MIRIEPPEDPEVEGRVRFDPDDAETMGVVSLDVPPWSAVVEGLARGVRYRVTFTPQDGSGRLEVTPDLVVTADGQELDLVLPATPAEAGPSDAGEPFSFGWRVVDVHGDPISPEQWLRAGLEVEPVVGMIAPDGSRFGSRTDITSVETHVGGDAVVRTFGPPFTAALFAGGREQARAEITESTGEVEFRVDLARRPADGRLEFHAFDPAGSPTMAQVRVLSLDAHHRAETWTVFEGRATLVLPPGAYVWEAETQLREFGIDARARGRVAATAGADVDVPIRFAAPGGVEVRIPPGIDARATDVSIASPASIHPIAHLAPSPDGTFRSHGLAPGDVRVVVSTRRGAPPLESVFPVPARIDSGTITRVDVPPAPETRRVRVELAGPEHAFVSAYSSPDELLFTLVVGSGADLLVPRRSARWRAWPAWVHDPSWPFSMDHVAGQAVGEVASEGGDGTTTLRFEWN